MFHNRLGFLRWVLLAPCPTPKLEDHPLLAVRDFLFNIYAVTLHIWRPSPLSATWGHAMPWRRNPLKMAQTLLKIHFNISLHLHLSLPTGLLPSRLQTKTSLCISSCPSHVQATCLVHLNHLIHNKENKLWIWSLGIFLQLSVTSCLLGPNSPQHPVLKHSQTALPWM
jgi:hypothetical protein